MGSAGLSTWKGFQVWSWIVHESKMGLCDISHEGFLVRFWGCIKVNSLGGGILFYFFSDRKELGELELRFGLK